MDNLKLECLLALKKFEGRDNNEETLVEIETEIKKILGRYLITDFNVVATRNPEDSTRVDIAVHPKKPNELLIGIELKGEENVGAEKF